jgi:hypothetical protein
MVRSAEEAALAHVQLWVFECASSVPDVLDASAALAEEGLGGAVLGGAGEAEAGGAPIQLLLLNKMDLVGGGGSSGVASAVPADRQWRISCATGEGVAPFLAQLGTLVRGLYGAWASAVCGLACAGWRGVRLWPRACLVGWCRRGRDREHAAVQPSAAPARTATTQAPTAARRRWSHARATGSTSRGASPPSRPSSNSRGSARR